MRISHSVTILRISKCSRERESTALLKMNYDSHLLPISANESKEIQQKNSLSYKHTDTSLLNIQQAQTAFYCISFLLSIHAV